MRKRERSSFSDGKTRAVAAKGNKLFGSTRIWSETSPKAFWNRSRTRGLAPANNKYLTLPTIGRKILPWLVERGLPLIKLIKWKFCPFVTLLLCHLYCACLYLQLKSIISIDLHLRHIIISSLGNIDCYSDWWWNIKALMKYNYGAVFILMSRTLAMKNTHYLLLINLIRLSNTNIIIVI